MRNTVKRKYRKLVRSCTTYEYIPYKMKTVSQSNNINTANFVKYETGYLTATAYI